MKYYSGIGSRETPVDILEQMKHIALTLALKGYTLRSGGARGADSAFEIGCDTVNGLKEIYLPWKNFNNNKSTRYTISSDAHDLAKKYHPRWDILSASAKKLMIRNCYQVLGYGLNTPVDFVVCWTNDGKASGGTGQAIRIANDYKIAVYNLYNKEDIARLTNLFKGDN